MPRLRVPFVSPRTISGGRRTRCSARSTPRANRGRTPASWRSVLAPVGLGLAALCLAPSTASAQQASGPWWELGVGAGWVRFTCDVCDAERDAGPVVRLAFGSVASERTVIGIEGTGWTHQDEEDDVRQKLFSVMGLGILRPSASGLSLTGGAGWVGWRAEDFSYNALGLKVGAGYTFDLGESVRVDNAIALTASSFGSLQNDGEVAEEDVSLSFLTFTVSVTAR